MYTSTSVMNVDVFMKGLHYVFIRFLGDDIERTICVFPQFSSNFDARA